MEIFYSDTEKTFQCKIVIESEESAISMDDAVARLVLDFGNNFCFLFQGKIDKSGKCKIKIPALKHSIKDEGKAILEVIADSMFFEPWESTFQVKKSKNVTVEKLEDDEMPKIKSRPLVSVVKEEIQSKALQTESKNSTSLFGEFLREFKEKNLANSTDYKKYVPSREAVKILKESKRDVTTPISKIFMYYLDKKVIR